PGSHLGAGFDKALDRVARALLQCLERCDDRTWLLIENTAGAGGTIGRSLEELAAICDRLDGHPRIGVCLDSCHLYASGYDVTDRGELDRVLARVDELIGLDRLRALHVNDCAAPLGPNRDRHANIGGGRGGPARTAAAASRPPGTCRGLTPACPERTGRRPSGWGRRVPSATRVRRGTGPFGTCRGLAPTWPGGHARRDIRAALWRTET